MTHPTAPALALALVALSPAVAAQEPTAADPPAPIVERAIEHHGGDLFERSESAFDIASKSGTFRVEVRRDGGLYRQVVEADTDEGRRRVTVTNDAVEVTVDGRALEVGKGDEQRWRDHVAARVWFPFLPYGLANDGVYTHDLGLEEWPVEDGGTRQLHRVKVTFEPGSSTEADDEYLFWFDPETGRLEQLAYSFAGGLRFRTAENFRRVGGLLFADHENFGVDARGLDVDQVTPEYVENEMEHVSTIELREIEVEPLGE